MSNPILCKHEDEEDISTFGNLGEDVQTLICPRCGREREVPYDWREHFGYPPRTEAVAP